MGGSHRGRPVVATHRQGEPARAVTTPRPGLRGRRAPPPRSPGGAPAPPRAVAPPRSPHRHRAPSPARRPRGRLRLPRDRRRAPWEAGSTWYRVQGDRPQPRAARRSCTAGPAAGMTTWQPLVALGDIGARACVLYDQIGCGRSQHLPDAPRDFWTVDLFCRELDALPAHLGIDGRYHVLGQSWGGMLGMEHAVRRPRGAARHWCRQLAGVDAAVGAGGQPPARAAARPTSRRRYAPRGGGHHRQRRYHEAMMVFYERHLCRIPFPEPLQRTFRADGGGADRLPHDERAQRVPRHRHVARLGHHAAPAPSPGAPLVISGEYDEATPAVVQPLVDAIPDAAGSCSRRQPLDPSRAARAVHRDRRTVPRRTRLTRAPRR